MIESILALTIAAAPSPVLMPPPPPTPVPFPTPVVSPKPVLQPSGQTWEQKMLERYNTRKKS